MRIYIDISVLTLATFITGIQRVTREIVVRLIELEKSNITLVYYNANKNSYYKIDNQRFCRYYLHGKGMKSRMITGHKVVIQEMERGSIFFDLDAAWMCRVKRSWLLPILKQQGVQIVVHIYDIISVMYPQYCLQRGVYNFMDYIGAHLQYADKIIVNAQATVEELGKLSDKADITLPPCYVVPLGADFCKNKQIRKQDIDQTIVQVAESKPFILMVGTIEPRKNHKLLLDAYDMGLKNMGYNIIFAGYMGWDMESLEQRMKSHSDYGKGIYHFEGLDDNTVSYLYQQAKFLAFCSYMEGYGLPIIEAMERGTPVLAADIPVLREVGEDYCVWFEQDNAQELCNKVKECSESMRKDDEKAPRISVSWDECEKKMLEVLKR